MVMDISFERWLAHQRKNRVNDVRSDEELRKEYDLLAAMPEAPIPE